MGDYLRSVAITLPAVAGMIAVSRLVDGWIADVLLLAFLAYFLAAMWHERGRSTRA